MTSTVCSVEISSFNCNGLADHKKRREIFAWLHDKRSNIICLQETHSKFIQEEASNREWGSKIIFNHGTSNQRGTAILFKNNISYSIHNSRSDDTGRWIMVVSQLTHYVLL